MRLIDADALLAEAHRLSGPQTGDGWDNWGVYNLIERQPTVAYTQRAGFWERVPDYPGDEDNPAWDCSECGAMVSRPYNYCPMCGSKNTESTPVRDKLKEIVERLAAMSDDELSGRLDKAKEDSTDELMFMYPRRDAE